MASRFDLLRAEVRVANLKPPRSSQEQRRRGRAQPQDHGRPGPRDAHRGHGRDGHLPSKSTADRELSPKRPNRLSQIDYQSRMAGEMIKIARGDDLPTLAISGNYSSWADGFAFGKTTGRISTRSTFR